MISRLKEGKDMLREIKKSRKAVSPVIATLLLIAIVVAASVVTYSWVMSMVKTQGGQAQTSIRIEEVLFGQRTFELVKGGIASIAEWSSTQAIGTYSAMLSQDGITSNHYAYVRVYPTTTITLNTLAETNMPTFKYYMSAACQPPALELLFEDPSSDGWVEVTVFAYAGYGPVTWPQETGTWINTASHLAGIMSNYAVAYGEDSDANPITKDNPSTTLTAVITAVVAQDATAANWVLTRVTPQVGWLASAQTVYIDDVTIDGVLYALEPALNAVKISIRNTGSVTAVIQTVYVYKGDTQILRKDLIGYAISATTLGEVGLKTTGTTWTVLKPSLGTEPSQHFEVTFAKDLVTSGAYVVKVVTDNGFSVEGTYYTPSEFK
jgi:flagellin-like protein